MNASLRFGHGDFYGARVPSFGKRRKVAGMVLDDLRPTVPESDVEPHTHDDAHFLLLLSGRYLSSAAGMPAVCEEPVLLVNPPGTEHRDCFRGLDGRFFTISMSNARWQSAAAARALDAQARRLPAAARILATRLWWRLSNWDAAAALDVEDGVEQLLDSAAVTQRIEAGPGPAWLSRVRERLHQADHAPSLAALAQEADVHPVAFSRAFRRSFGCSPGEYRRRCRMDRAAALLEQSRPRLIDIAAECGFSDQAHFNRRFRQDFGCTPGEYRVMSRSGRGAANNARFRTYKAAGD